MNDVVGEQIDFAALVQNIPDSLVVVDSAINLVFVNQAGVELLGWKAEDWHGRSLLELGQRRLAERSRHGASDH